MDTVEPAMAEANDAVAPWIGEMLRAVRSRWPLVLAIMAAFFVVALVYLRTTSYTYTVGMRVSSAQASSQPGGLGALGGIAAIAGLGGGMAGDTATPFKLYLEGLTSREVATRLSHDPEIMHAVFARQWDARTKSWQQPTSALRGIKNAIFSVLGLPVYPWSPPGAAELQEYLARTVVINQTTKSPLVTLTVESADPAFAIKFLTKLHEANDAFVREQAKARTESNIDYLKTRVDDIGLTQFRQVLFSAIAEQGQQMMLVNATAPYAAEPFGPSSASPRPTAPRPIPVLAGATIAGLIAGLALAALLGRPGQRRGWWTGVWRVRGH
jgi:uncharacterized protein involved in exopolysaccharide biosynthesis